MKKRAVFKVLKRGIVIIVVIIFIIAMLAFLSGAIAGYAKAFEN